MDGRETRQSADSSPSIPGSRTAAQDSNLHVHAICFWKHARSDAWKRSRRFRKPLATVGSTKYSISYEVIRCPYTDLHRSVSDSLRSDYRSVIRSSSSTDWKKPGNCSGMSALVETSVLKISTFDMGNLPCVGRSDQEESLTAPTRELSISHSSSVEVFEYLPNSQWMESQSVRPTTSFIQTLAWAKSNATVYAAAVDSGEIHLISG